MRKSLAGLASVALVACGSAPAQPAEAAPEANASLAPAASAAPLSSAAPAPSAAPAGPGLLDREALAHALDAIDPHACAPAPLPPFHLALVLEPNGSASQAKIDDGPLVGTPAAACVEKAYLAVRIPAFAGAPVRVGKTMPSHDASAAMNDPPAGASRAAEARALLARQRYAEARTLLLARLPQSTQEEAVLLKQVCKQLADAACVEQSDARVRGLTSATPRSGGDFLNRRD